ATYTLPSIASASIGPSAAVVDGRPDGATVYAGTHRPFGLRDAVAGSVGLAKERVRVMTQMSSGTYGRSNATDVAGGAAVISRPERRAPVHDPERACLPARRANAAAHRELPLARGGGERLRVRVVRRRAGSRFAAGPARVPAASRRRPALAPRYRAGRRSERVWEEAPRAARARLRLHALSRHLRRAGRRGRGRRLRRRTRAARVVRRRSRPGDQSGRRAQSGRGRDPAIGIVDVA